MKTRRAEQYTERELRQHQGGVEKPPRSAILSAVIFNALIIGGLIPLSLRGVKFRAESAAVMLRRNLLIYGLGGLIAPFVGIKLIDLVISALGVN